jgi:hypothetical protein
MKRGQWVALAGGTALGLAGVSLGVILARREGREAARRWIEQYGMPLADQAKQIGTQIANAAMEQYQMQMPKAVDAWNTYAPQAKEALNSFIAQAPQAAGALSGIMPGGANGKTQSATMGGGSTNA